MKSKLIKLLFVLFGTAMMSQNIGEFTFENIINDYKTNIENVTPIQNCGHFLDTPATFVKEMENRSLDAMLPFANIESDKIGKEVYADILNSNVVIENHWGKTEILNVVNRLINAMQPENKRNFKLTILDSETINAFTTFGGYIYLTTGLIDFVDSYDELAFILGHEIGHDVKLHTQRKITKMAATDTFFNNISLKDFKDMAIGMNIKFSAPFAQIDEYEADQYGFELAEKAGYDVTRFEDFFEKMEKHENKSILRKMTSTHPFAEDRKNCINQYITK